MVSWLFQPDHTESLLFLHKLSNLLIAFSYFAISAMVSHFWRKRKNDVAPLWVLVLFVAAISLCGLSHIDNILSFYWPIYRFYTTIFVLTAITTLGIIIIFPSISERLLRLPSQELNERMRRDLDRLIAEKNVENRALHARNQKLIGKVILLEEMLENNAWMHDKGMALTELRELLLTIGEPLNTKE